MLSAPAFSSFAGCCKRSLLLCAQPHTTFGYGTGISMVHPFRSMAGTEFTEKDGRAKSNNQNSPASNIWLIENKASETTAKFQNSYTYHLKDNRQILLTFSVTFQDRGHMPTSQLPAAGSPTRVPGLRLKNI